MAPPAEVRSVTEAFERFGARLVSYAVSVCGRREEAEDAVQTVFARLAANPSLLLRARDSAAYLFRSVRRAALRVRERESRASRIPEGYLRAVADDGPSRDLCRSIERALGELPDSQREVVFLRFWGGLTFPQMAKALETSPRTLESRWRVAMERLRTKLRTDHD